jgi:hypothetical protein
MVMDALEFLAFTMKKRETGPVGGLLLNYLKDHVEGLYRHVTARQPSVRSAEESLTNDIDAQFQGGFTINTNARLNRFMVNYDIIRVLKNHVGYKSWDDVPASEHNPCHASMQALLSTPPPTLLALENKGRQVMPRHRPPPRHRRRGCPTKLRHRHPPRRVAAVARASKGQTTMPRHRQPSHRLVSQQRASTILRPAANSASKSGMAHKAEAPSSAPPLTRRLSIAPGPRPPCLACHLPLPQKLRCAPMTMITTTIPMRRQSKPGAVPASRHASPTAAGILHGRCNLLWQTAIVSMSPSTRTRRTPSGTCTSQPSPWIRSPAPALSPRHLATRQ